MDKILEVNEDVRISGILWSLKNADFLKFNSINKTFKLGQYPVFDIFEKPLKNTIQDYMGIVSITKFSQYKGKLHELTFKNYT